MSQPTSPRIYVADLAAYNAGRLHGAWIDATQDVEAILEEVQEMLYTSPEPTSGEYAIHDADGFEGIRIDAWASLETVHEMAFLSSSMAGWARRWSTIAATMWMRRSASSRMAAIWEHGRAPRTVPRT